MILTEEKQFTIDRLSEEFKNIGADRLKKALDKGATVVFKCSISEKEKMVERASGFGLSLTEFLTRLFHISEQVLNDMPLFEEKKLKPIPIKTPDNNGSDLQALVEQVKTFKKHGNGKFKKNKDLATIKDLYIKLLKSGLTKKDASEKIGMTPLSVQNWRKKDSVFNDRVIAITGR